LAPSTTVHGTGDVGGKGEGLLLLDRLELSGAQKLRSEIVATSFYERYCDNGRQFDDEALDHLRELHGSFPARPISVRASEMPENDPLAATSGESASYMLPNVLEERSERFEQFLRAIEHIYDNFTARHEAAPHPNDRVAVLVNPIPGVSSISPTGPLFYPMSSGVADSFFKHPLTLDDGLQNPREGFARVAVGHGYAVVLDEFEVVPVATIEKPLDPQMVTRRGQQHFYALVLDRRLTSAPDEMCTMAKLHRRFADPAALACFVDERDRVTFAPLLKDDAFGYRRGLCAIMEQLHKPGGDFQIEFTWNLVDGEGTFHLVQYKKLRNIDLRNIRVPDFDRRALISTTQFQGHGVLPGIRYAVVINPFSYRSELHDQVVARLKEINEQLRQKNERYILVCPGRVGTTNREWGFQVEFQSISGAAAIVEFGYDVNGSATISVSRDELTGGIFGSHYLYQILGGASEAERARRARLFGSQGTHFLTNLYTNETLYLFVNPERHFLSPWFFSPPPDGANEPIYLKRFDHSFTAYADLFERKCIISYSKPDDSDRPAKRRAPRPGARVINPHKLKRAFVFSASSSIRQAAHRLDQRHPYCSVHVQSDPTTLSRPLAERTFVLILDEGALALFDRDAFEENNPTGVVVFLSSDLRVGCAPTRAEVERICPLAAKADFVFYVDDADCRPSRVMPAAIRYAEDQHNIAEHTHARRFIFLVVDDELRWLSQFLPLLYRLIGQRASIMTARTFEHARAIMDEHGSNVVCLITDMMFPKGGEITPDAGRELVISTKLERPRIPIIIASKADQGMDLQEMALLLPKGEPGAVDKLDQYVHDFSGLGDFLLIRHGKLWRRASTLQELRDAVSEAPIELLEEYAEKDYFSTWLYMHGFAALADTLRPGSDRGDRLRGVLLSAFDDELDIVARQEIVLVNHKREEVGRAQTVLELAALLQRVDHRTLKEYSVTDRFSLWLMRKGYPELADQIRPIHGEGEQLRDEMVAVFDDWLRSQEPAES
jgi:hypothetical protein